MGLEIVGSMVIVNHTSKDHLFTDLYSNPSKALIGSVNTQSVYRRKKSPGADRRDRDAKRLGDNCPLIYALKGKHGLDVNASSIKRLMEFMPEILDRIICDLPEDLTDIVTIPSGYPLAKILAKRLSRKLALPVKDGLLRKSSCFEATRRADKLLKTDPRSISREMAVDVRNTVKRIVKTAKEPYSSKDVPVSVRNFFDPLQIEQNQSLIGAESKVLLVDDLLASGETIMAANVLLKQAGLETDCNAVTWFSKV